MSSYTMIASASYHTGGATRPKNKRAPQLMTWEPLKECVLAPHEGSPSSPDPTSIAIPYIPYDIHYAEPPTSSSTQRDVLSVLDQDRFRCGTCIRIGQYALGGRRRKGRSTSGHARTCGRHADSKRRRFRASKMYNLGLRILGLSATR